MAKIEMSYNPFLMETKVKFDENAPRIDSQVEKYKNTILQKWLRDLPEIFLNEMNGDDFDLEFSGTESDFHQIENAFAGMDVRLFHKNSLNDRIDKLKESYELYGWLADRQNSNFDFGNFQTENPELFEYKPTVKLLYSTVSDKIEEDAFSVAIEAISSLEILSDTDLTDTPVVFNIGVALPENFKQDLNTLLARSDVFEQQLFFLVDEGENRAQITRNIADFGVKNPRIICDINDMTLRQYLKDYTLSDHLYEVLQKLNAKAQEIDGLLEIESENCNERNIEIKAEIDQISERIQRQKDLLFQFENRDRTQIYLSKLREAKAKLLSDVTNWQKKTTKMTTREEAGRKAKEYNNHLRNVYAHYKNKVSNIIIDQAKELNRKYSRWITKSEQSIADPRLKIPFEFLSGYNLPDLSAHFLRINKTEQVSANSFDFFSFFQDADSSLLEMVTNYYYHDWREYAKETISEEADSILDACRSRFSAFEEQLTENYINEIKKLLAESNAVKVVRANQLSDEAQKWQADRDWLTEFRDKIEMIERY